MDNFNLIKYITESRILKENDSLKTEFDNLFDDNQKSEAVYLRYGRGMNTSFIEMLEQLFPDEILNDPIKKKTFLKYLKDFLKNTEEVKKIMGDDPEYKSFITDEDEIYYVVNKIKNDAYLNSLDSDSPLKEPKRWKFKSESDAMDFVLNRSWREDWEIETPDGKVLAYSLKTLSFEVVFT